MKVSGYKFSDDGIKNPGQYRDKQDSYRIKTGSAALPMLSQGISPGSVSSITGNSVYTAIYRFKLCAEEGVNRLNISGAYNPGTCSFIHPAGGENCNAGRAVRFCDLTVKSYPEASPVTLYSDSAEYFHTGILKERPEKNPRLHTVSLPAYAPGLNLTGLFRKSAEEKPVKNKYYQKYKTFGAKVFRFLNSTAEYPDELKKLTAEKFEIIYA